MSSAQKSNLVNVFTILAIVFAAFQALIPSMPINPDSITVVSAITLFLVTGVTVWKQYLSEEISNSAIRPTLIVAIVATLAGIADLLNVFPFDEKVDQWIRFGITAVTTILNTLSKVLWQTPQTKSLI